LIANYNGMACIVAALIADYIFDSITEKICGFSLALIAPLSTKQNNGWHANFSYLRGLRHILTHLV
jgi:hypothetical protein